MDESVVTLQVEDADSGYAISYSGSATPASVPADALDVSTLVSFAADAAEGYAATGEAEQQGRRLYQFLVGDRPWAGAFRDELDRSAGIHIRLDVRSPALRPVSWEMMYEGGFLALMEQVRFSRVGSPQAAMRPFDRPVRVVLLLSNIPEFQSEKEADAIFKALEHSQREGLVNARQVRYRSQASLAEIGACDILHIHGHIQVTDGEPLLMLDRQAYLPFGQLVEVCRRFKPLLVYLSTCNGTAVPGGQPERSPVYLLQEAGVSNVIGPYGQTTVWSTFSFASSFYLGLASGMSAAAAVARARRQLAKALRPDGHLRQSKARQGQPLDWVGPVLYQSGDMGMAFSQAGMVAQAKSPVSSPQQADSMQEVAFSLDMMSTESMPSWSAPTQPDLDTEGASPTTTLLPAVESESFVSSSVYVPSESIPSLLSQEEVEGEEAVEGLRTFLRAHVVGAETLGLLRSSLQSSDRRQQVAAVDALGLLGERQPSVRDVLIELVTDREGTVADSFLRRKAVEQLGHIRDRTAVDALLLAMADPEEDVRQAAKSALTRVSQRAQEAPERALLSLPLASGEAIECVAPLRQAVANAPNLAPRQRVEAMKQVEALRFELIRSRPRVDRVNALLEALWAISPEIKSLTMNLKGRIELTTPDKSTPLPDDKGREADRREGGVQ